MSAFTMLRSISHWDGIWWELELQPLCKVAAMGLTLLKCISATPCPLTPFARAKKQQVLPHVRFAFRPLEAILVEVFVYVCEAEW